MPTDSEWVSRYAWPFFELVDAFWRCYLVNTTLPGGCVVRRCTAAAAPAALPFTAAVLLLRLLLLLLLLRCRGYEYWDPDDCDGDENCSLPPEQRTNPAWAMAFLRRFYWAMGVRGGGEGRAGEGGVEVCSACGDLRCPLLATAAAAAVAAGHGDCDGPPREPCVGRHPRAPAAHPHDAVREHDHPRSAGPQPP